MQNPLSITLPQTQSSCSDFSIPGKSSSFTLCSNIPYCSSTQIKMQSKLLTTTSHANRRSIMTHNSPSQTHTYQTSLTSTKPVNHIPRPTLNSWVLTSIVISCLLSGSVAECPLHNPCISRVSGFLDRQLCCQASLQPISENSYYQGLGMGWEWKHVLLYLANTLAVHGLTCPICFQCRGRPDFLFQGLLHNSFTDSFKLWLTDVNWWFIMTKLSCILYTESESPTWIFRNKI